MRLKILFGIIFLTAFVSHTFAQTETRNLRGKIGENSIQMTLQINGKELTGKYFYEKYLGEIKLSGSIREDGNLVLTETAPNGTKTGEFSGVLSKSESDETISIYGEWKNPQGTKTLEFLLTEQLIFFTDKAKIITKNFAEISKPKAYSITAEYPQLSDVSPAIALKFNQLAKTGVMNEVAKFRKDMLGQTPADIKNAQKKGMTNTSEISYNIVYADNDLISVWFGNYFYTGGAHPNGYSFTLNFDLKTGRELKLADIFKPNSDFLKVLADYCIKRLQDDLEQGRDDEWIQTGAGAKSENYKSWNFSKKGIIVNFDSYQVAPYVAGPQEVMIPYGNLKNILGKSYSVFNLR